MKLYRSPPTKLWESLCARSQIIAVDLEKVCKEIFETVKKDRDQALLAYTKKFDNIKLSQVLLSISQMEKLAKQTPEKLQRAIDEAYMNIQKFHRTQINQSDNETIETESGVICWRESRPIERVGLYVPGGTAPLISTALMLGVPAQLAGCSEVVLCTPPSSDGAINPAICYAALKIGATKIARIGGIQAIAGLTSGTESIPKVDKIFGPGNQYVTAAKQYGQKLGVAIDLPAGPSEVMVLADESARPSFVAADLLSQAEHGDDSQVMLVTTSEEVARAVMAEVYKQVETLPRKIIAKTVLENSACIILPDLTNAFSFANMYAPEHAILSIQRPEKWTKLLVNAGSVFLGNYTPESAGDYASGTNHTLPTNGWAKSYSGLSVADFQKQVSFQSITKAGLRNLAPTIIELARAEGLEAHARAVTIRTKVF